MLATVTSPVTSRKTPIDQRVAGNDWAWIMLQVLGGLDKTSATFLLCRMTGVFQ